MIAFRRTKLVLAFDNTFASFEVLSTIFTRQLNTPMHMRTRTISMILRKTFSRTIMWFSINPVWSKYFSTHQTWNKIIFLLAFARAKFSCIREALGYFHIFATIKTFYGRLRKQMSHSDNGGAMLTSYPIVRNIFSAISTFFTKTVIHYCFSFHIFHSIIIPRLRIRGIQNLLFYGV
jgi:hypothetical protein